MSILNKLKRNRHHSIERFGVLFISLSIAMGLVMCVGVYSYIQQNLEHLSTQALYTKQFTTSKTNVPGTVEGIYVSSDRKRAFLLIKFDNIAAVSLNSDDYQAFLTASNTKQKKEDLQSHPAASIYSFGVSGYMGFYFVNNQGFPSQILDLTVRANSQIVKSDMSDELTSDDGAKRLSSFQLHDQFRIFFNPGAEQATISRVLSNPDFKPADIYREMIVTKEQDAIKKKLNDAIDTMYVSQKAIRNYIARFSSINIGERHLVTPDNVNKILEDKITETKDANGNVTSRQFEPKYILPGGYNFDWQDKGVDSYLDQVKPKNESTLDFLKAKANEANMPNQYDFSSFGTWMLDDGTKFDDYVSKTGADVDKNINDANNNIANLSSAVETYMGAKTKYQKELLKQLIDLEISLDGINDSASISTSNTIRLY